MPIKTRIRLKVPWENRPDRHDSVRCSGFGTWSTPTEKVAEGGQRPKNAPRSTDHCKKTGQRKWKRKGKQIVLQYLQQRKLKDGYNNTKQQPHKGRSGN